jgi:LPXTG-site transpeptidase (sortase) family protein
MWVNSATESLAATALPQVAPLPPSTGSVAHAVAAPAAVVATPPAPPAKPQAPDAPARLVIPAIGLNNPIVKVGTNSRGEMDVPSGTTNQVGWYARGTSPGEVGSAVIGAHVYAAFGKLNRLKAGNTIEVVAANGIKQTFVVEEVKTYKLGDMSAYHLFNRSDARRLNLITCAGSPTADGSTYTHRLVVYATLVE